MWLSSASLRRQSFGSHSSSIANSGLRRDADGARVAGAFFPGHIESKICLRKRSRRLLLPTPTAKQMVREAARAALHTLPDDGCWRVGLWVLHATFSFIGQHFSHHALTGVPARKTIRVPSNS